MLQRDWKKGVSLTAREHETADSERSKKGSPRRQSQPMEVVQQPRMMPVPKQHKASKGKCDQPQAEQSLDRARGPWVAVSAPIFVRRSLPKLARWVVLPKAGKLVNVAVGPKASKKGASTGQVETRPCPFPRVGRELSGEGQLGAYFGKR